MAYPQHPGASSYFQPPASQAQTLQAYPSPASSDGQHGNPQAAVAMPPPAQRSSQPQYNALTGLASTVSPPARQAPLRPPPIPTSMTAGAQIPSAQSTPTIDVSSQAKATTPKQASQLTAQEQERVTALLHLNGLVLRELQFLQTAGAALPPTQTSPQQQTATQPKPQENNVGEAHRSPTAGPTSTTPTTTTPTPQTPRMTKPPLKSIYDNYLKRLQVNIAYLLALSQGKPVPPHPLAMEPPPEAWSIPGPGEVSQEAAAAAGYQDPEERGREAARELREAYQKLKDLWPNYKAPIRGQQQQRPQQGQPGQLGQAGQAPVQQGPMPAQAPVQTQSQGQSGHPGQ